MNSPLELNLKERVTLEDAEHAVLTLGVAPEFMRDLRCDLSKLWDIQIGAGERLGNAFRRFQSHDFTAEVPPMSSTLAYRRSSWALLADCGIGSALACHAKSVVSDGVDVTEQFRQFQRRACTDTDRNLIIIEEPQSGVRLNVENVNAFRIDFYSLISELDDELMADKRDQIAPLVDLFREAILNIADHASRTPLPQGQHVRSYCTLSCIDDIRQLKGGSGPTVQFINRLREQIGSNAKKSRFLRIVVSDDGVGIAGRIAQTNEIYWNRVEKEAESLNHAFEAGFSIKPLTIDAVVRGDPGYGFSIMGESIRRLRAFASIRTGRFLAFCDGTSPGALGSHFTTAKDAVSARLGYVPGTLIESLIPL